MSVFSNLGLSPSPKFEAPFPQWSPRDVQIVEQAIVSAWQHLAKNQTTKNVLNSGTEIKISAQLIETLERILNAGLIKGFTGRRFSPPARGQELEDVTGKQFEKRPDLTFRLTSSLPYTQHNSLFFECKRISPKRRVADYVDKGLIKFCDQRYAWGMQHAGMLAYVQNVAPPPQAKSELEKHWAKHPSSPTVPLCDVTLDTSGSISVAITQHRRCLPLPNGKASGSITLRHLWLIA